MPQYDEIVTLTQSLDTLKSQIASNNSPFTASNDELSDKVAHYFSLIDQKMQQLEQIKTAASMLRNTLYYLPKLNLELQQPGHEQAALAQQIYADVLTYNFYADENKLNEINHKLHNIGQNPDSHLITNLKLHLQAHLKQQHQLKQLYNRFVDIPSRTAFSALNSQYNQYHLSQLQQNKKSNQLTLLLSAALLLTLFIIYKCLNRARFRAF